MTSVSPPKPWERATAAAPAMAVPSSTSTATTAAYAATAASTAATAAPSLPDRPSSLNSVINQTASAYTNPVTAGAYSGAYSSPYSSPYNRFGSYGGMYGSAYGGYGGYGMGSILTQTWNQSTAATFQLMESIVRAFGGFAQMLESAYMTTQSSFFAMVSMAEQLGNLRHTLGSLLGIYAMLRWARTLIAKLTGRPPPADAAALTPAAFSHFLSGGKSAATLPDGSPAPPRPSRKPFIMFAIAVFGIPYLMGKMIKAMAASQEEAQRKAQEQGLQIVMGPNGEQIPVDPKNLDFCRAVYDYTPGPQSTGMDLEVRKGDLVAVLSKTDPVGNPSDWWQCRSRQGKIGYLPSTYLQTIQRPVQRQQQALTTGSETASTPASRTTTLRGNDLDGQRTKSLTSIKPLAAKAEAKAADISVDSFQKSAFYS
ncbi:hypothetical protein DV736_g6392, partial [Chaetothyriales sp. CBS 134916]